MITLAFFFKNEEVALDHMLTELLPYVDEIIGLDDESTDGSAEIVREMGGRVYTAKLSDFGSNRTLAAHLAREPVVLMIDPDESLRYKDRLRPLAKTIIEGGAKAYKFPRKRWADLEMKKELEPDAFPDWQVRLFANDPSYIFEREIHEYFTGAPVKCLDFDRLPEIAHFDTVFHKAARIADKNRMFHRLIARRGPGAFVAEYLQQSLKECHCFNETSACDRCVVRRDVATGIMHKMLSWQETEETVNGVYKIGLSFDELRHKFSEAIKS